MSNDHSARNKARLASTAFALAILATNSTAACNIVNGKAYGDCAGVTVRRGTTPHLEIRDARSEGGISAGATVYAGGSYSLSGVSNGDIVVHRGGRLFVSGIVNGQIRNLGGAVELEGSARSLLTIGGEVVVGGTVGTVAGPGAVHFRTGSVLGGVPFQESAVIGGKPI